MVDEVGAVVAVWNVWNVVVVAKVVGVSTAEVEVEPAVMVGEQ